MTEQTTLPALFWSRWKQKATDALPAQDTHITVEGPPEAVAFVFHPTPAQVLQVIAERESAEQENARLRAEAAADSAIITASAFETCREHARALKAEAQLATAREALTGIIHDVQEWCEAVAEDASWDSWDSHYKALWYNGDLDHYKAALAAITTNAGSDAQAGEVRNG